MPLGKYYCDYCHKQFQDTPFARKRHLHSLQHLRAKARWYDSLNSINFQDPIHVHPEGFGKGVCNRFLRTGNCQYGDSCKYFHPKNLPTTPSFLNCDNRQMPMLQSGHYSVGGGFFSGDMVQDSMGMSWQNLPPSLMPPLEGRYPPLPFLDWG